MVKIAAVVGDSLVSEIYKYILLNHLGLYLVPNPDCLNRNLTLAANPP